MRGKIVAAPAGATANEAGVQEQSIVGAIMPVAALIYNPLASALRTGVVISTLEATENKAYAKSAAFAHIFTLTCHMCPMCSSIHYNAQRVALVVHLQPTPRAAYGRQAGATPRLALIEDAPP